MEKRGPRSAVRIVQTQDSSGIGGHEDRARLFLPQLIIVHACYRAGGSFRT